MTDLAPVSELSAVPQLETSTLALAGPGNPMNQQAQALLNRTEFLNGARLAQAISLAALEGFSAGIIDSSDVNSGAAMVAGTIPVVRTSDNSDTLNVDITVSTAALQAEIDKAIAWKRPLYLPCVDYTVNATLLIDDSFRIVPMGSGLPRIIMAPGMADAVFRASDADEVHLAAVELVCNGSLPGQQTGAIELYRCTNSSVRGVRAMNPDAFGVYAFECDNVIIDDLYTEGDITRYDNGVGSAPYVVELAGCSNTKVTSSHGLRTNFGFVIIGKEYTDNAGSSYKDAITRPVEDTIGNKISICTISHHNGTAFDVNGAYDASFEGCTASKFEGSGGFPSFQSKHPDSANALHNRFENCHADDVYSGFYAQEGSRVQFIGCSARKVQTRPIRLNNCPYSQIVGFHAYWFGTLVDAQDYAAVTVRASSQTIVDDITIDASTAGANACGVLLELGSSNCSIGTVQARGTLKTGLGISADSASNIIGQMFRIGGATCTTYIDDLSGTTTYPVVHTQALALASTGTVYFRQQPQRGMIVALAKAFIATTVGGSPQVQCGGSGIADLVDPVVLAGAAGTFQALTLKTQLTTATAVLRGNVPVAGTGEAVLHLYGIPRL